MRPEILFPLFAPLDTLKGVGPRVAPLLARVAGGDKVRDVAFLRPHALVRRTASTLGAAIAYPEILQIFARTVLNQSGRAIEVMTLVLGVFLVINLLASAGMNAWNRRLALQGR